MTESHKTSARCDCGALTLEITGDPVMQLVCHCSDCRQITGAPYADIAFFHPDVCRAHGQVRSTTMKGATGYEKTYYSCESCQKQLYATVTVLNGAVGVMANRISAFHFEPRVHIWTSEKMEGVTIPENITQSSGAPPKEIADTMISVFWGK